MPLATAKSFLKFYPTWMSIALANHRAVSTKPTSSTACHRCMRHRHTLRAATWARLMKTRWTAITWLRWIPSTSPGTLTWELFWETISKSRKRKKRELLLNIEQQLDQDFYSFRKSNKRSGIATNPAMRLIRNRIDSAANLIRRTNNYITSGSQGSSSIGVKSSTFQWRKESQMWSGARDMNC